MNQIALQTMRYVRIRSWKDIVLIVLIGVVYVGLDFGLKKLFPTMEEKHVKTICWVVSFIFALIVLFSVSWFSE